MVTAPELEIYKVAEMGGSKQVGVMSKGAAESCLSTRRREVAYV